MYALMPQFYAEEMMVKEKNVPGTKTNWFLAPLTLGLDTVSATHSAVPSGWKA
jgi:hypothetical protein